MYAMKHRQNQLCSSVVHTRVHPQPNAARTGNETRNTSKMAVKKPRGKTAKMVGPRVKWDAVVTRMRMGSHSGGGNYAWVYGTLTNT